MKAPPSFSRQRGVTLIVAMVLLVVLTIFALGMMRLSTNSLQVIGNMQAVRETEARAQTAVERRLESVQPFKDAVTILTSATPSTTAAATTCDGTNFWTAEGSTYVCLKTESSYTMRVYLPECIFVEPSPGYPIDEMPGYSPPEDTYWNVRGVATDSLTGANAEINQGIRIQRTKGNCP